MNIYLGVTDTNWFSQLKQQPTSDINFWRPSSQQTFQALKPGEPFLFKLKQDTPATREHDFVGGVAFFQRFELLKVSQAWQAFGLYNGVRSQKEFVERMVYYRKRTGKEVVEDPTIGCIVMSDPVYFDSPNWVPIPDWPKHTVQGRKYTTDAPEGQQIWQAVRQRLEDLRPNWDQPASPVGSLPSAAAASEPAMEFGHRWARVRHGQGVFRLQVAQQYGYRCALTNESALPTLEAAHIKPVRAQGSHAFDNGILMRRDLHSLFDAGYIGITADYRVQVSAHLGRQFPEHGYDKLAGSCLQNLPEDPALRPALPALAWHLEHVFLG